MDSVNLELESIKEQPPRSRSQSQAYLILRCNPAAQRSRAAAVAVRALAFVTLDAQALCKYEQLLLGTSGRRVLGGRICNEWKLLQGSQCFRDLPHLIWPAGGRNADPANKSDGLAMQKGEKSLDGARPGRLHNPLQDASRGCRQLVAQLLRLHLATSC
jgi:hypothetical protein